MARAPSGTIRLRDDGRYEIRIVVEDTDTGQKDRRSFYVRGSHRDANRLRAELMGKVFAGQNLVDRDRQSVDVFVDVWLRAVEATIRKTTHDGYRHKLRYLTGRYGGQQLRRLNGGRLNVLYGEMVGSGLSASTVKHLHRVVHKMLKDAVRWGVFGFESRGCCRPATG